MKTGTPKSTAPLSSEAKLGYKSSAPLTASKREIPDAPKTVAKHPDAPKTKASTNKLTFAHAALANKYDFAGLYTTRASYSFDGKKKKTTLKDQYNQGAIHFEIDEDKDELNISALRDQFQKKWVFFDDESKPTLKKGNFTGTLEIYDVDPPHAVICKLKLKNGQLTPDNNIEHIRNTFEKEGISTSILVNGVELNGLRHKERLTEKTRPTEKGLSDDVKTAAAGIVSGITPVAPLETTHAATIRTPSGGRGGR